MRTRALPRAMLAGREDGSSGARSDPTPINCEVGGVVNISPRSAVGLTLFCDLGENIQYRPGARVRYRRWIGSARGFLRRVSVEVSGGLLLGGAEEYDSARLGSYLAPLGVLGLAVGIALAAADMAGGTLF